MADITFTIDAVDTASRVLQGLMTNFGNLGRLMNDIATANWSGAILSGLDLAKEAVDLAGEEETSLIRLGATIKSMGLESKISAGGVRDLAESLMAATNIDHESLESAAEVFMRMDSFDPSNLEKMLTVTADFAAGTGQNAASAAQQIATALETGQTRSLHFSAALRTQVGDMIKAGDEAGAFTVIMDELNKRYGGQAAAQMDTYAGKLKQLSNSWSELEATAGNIGLPGGKTAIDLLIGPIQTMDQWLQIMAASHYNIIGFIQLMHRANEEQGETATNVEWLDKGERDLIPTLEEANSGLETQTQVLEDLKSQYSAISSFAQDWTKSTADITDAQKKAQDAFVKFGASSQEYKDAAAEVKKLQDAQKLQTDMWVLDVITQQLASNGLTSTEMNFLLQYQVNTGIITQEAADRAQAVWDEAISIANALNSIPDETAVDVTVTTKYNYVGNSPDNQGYAPGSGQTNLDFGKPGPHAGGGAFRGWAMVGDAPGGRMTPYTEFVYAPGGAMVLNQSQMAGRSAMPMSGGGVIGGETTINIYNPSPEAAEDSIDREMRRLSFLGVRQ